MLGIIGIGGGELLILFFLMPVFLVFTAFWVWMLVSAIQNKGLTEGEKIGWVLAIVFLQIIGGLLYLILGHPKRNLPRPTPG
jgi:hypothetical protein